jgi:hypothetical protein
MAIPSSGEQTKAPGVFVGCDTVGDNVNVGGTEVGVMVVVVLGIGVSVG